MGQRQSGPGDADRFEGSNGAEWGGIHINVVTCFQLKLLVVSPHARFIWQNVIHGSRFLEGRNVKRQLGICLCF